MVHTVYLTLLPNVPFRFSDVFMGLKGNIGKKIVKKVFLIGLSLLTFLWIFLHKVEREINILSNFYKYFFEDHWSNIESTQVKNVKTYQSSHIYRSQQLHFQS